MHCSFDTHPSPAPCPPLLLPQLLLECAHEALWHAAGAGASLAAGAPSVLGSDGCVAVGIASAEYNNWVLRRAGLAASAYSATGGERAGGQRALAETGG